MTPTDTAPKTTRKSRRSGGQVVPQRATLDAWFQTFGMWSVEQQVIALEVVNQIHHQTKRLLSGEVPSQASLVKEGVNV